MIRWCLNWHVLQKKLKTKSYLKLSLIVGCDCKRGRDYSQPQKIALPKFNTKIVIINFLNVLTYDIFYVLVDGLIMSWVTISVEAIEITFSELWYLTFRQHSLKTWHITKKQKAFLIFILFICGCWQRCKKNYRNVRQISRHYFTVTRCSLFQSCFVALMVAIYCDVSSMRFLQDFVIVGCLIRNNICYLKFYFNSVFKTSSNYLIMLFKIASNGHPLCYFWSDQIHFPFIFCRINVHRFIMIVLESNYAKLKRNLFLL